MPMTVLEFVDSQQAHTGLAWVAGRAGAHRSLGLADRSTVDQVGYLNLIHPHRLCVFGPDEINWYTRLDPDRRERLIEDLLTAKPPALIVANGAQAPAELIARCEAHGQPLLASSMDAARVIESVRYFLSKSTDDSTSMHGVLMDVLGMGVMISGDSGLGKSELALELISRGHGLVADDVVELTRVGPNSIEGRCPKLLQGLLEVRGLGLIDIKTVFGETAVRRRMRLKLIVNLVRRSTVEEHQYERLPLQEMTQDVLGVPIRKVAIPVAAGRNLAVLTEAAVRTTVLALRGIDTTRDFVRRQQQAIADSGMDYDGE
jgi:HPr kinase/phosphorylase